MTSRSWLAGLLLAPVVASTGCAGPHYLEPAGPMVPTVASIPVAPLPAAPALPSPPMALAAPASPVVSPEMPDLPVTGFEPTSLAFPSLPRIVLVDELPYRSSRGFSRARTDDPTARPHTAPRNGHRGTRSYHPDPGVAVDVMAADGGLAAVEVQRALRSAGYWPFRRCYEEGLRRDQRLTGRVALEVAVSPSGTLDRVDIMSASLRDESVGLCIDREAMHLTLPPGPAPTTATLTVTLSTGDEPVPVPPPMANADVLRDALRASWPAVEQCYAAQLAMRPGAGGRLELRFRASASGEIVEVAEGGFGDADVTRCILRVYRTARLPAAGICSARDTSFYYAMHLEAKP